MDTYRLVKDKLVKNFEQAGRTTLQLVELFPTPFSDVPTVGSDRSLQQLLEHAAFIPEEEMLLMKGLPRSEIYPGRSTSILTASDFGTSFYKSLDFFKEEVARTDLEVTRRNARNVQLTGFEWCLEALSHFYHHRSQVYVTVRARNIQPSPELLQALFPGHLPRDA